MNRFLRFKLQHLGCLVIGVFGLVVVYIYLLPVDKSSPSLFVNTSTSVPLGLYHMTKVSDLKRGDVIRLCLPEALNRFAIKRGYLRQGVCPGGATRVGKPVIALHGDTVVVTEKAVQINGSDMLEVPVSMHDRRGRCLANAIGIHILAPDECFLISTHHQLSYDSRYYGPVPCGGPPYYILTKR
ncbi:MAG: conjugative transfer signal peptidase TraF [Bacteroidetes bacterium]|nr:conjugative transfer signal peptidase TraF [Bacteroidota bacterium]